MTKPRRRRVHVFSTAPILLSLVLALGCATFSSVRREVARMTLEEKIGQLFAYAAHGVFMNEQSPEFRRLVHQVRENRVGGIIWFLSNVYETAHLNARLQKIARVPLLVSADLEAGSGMRFVDTTLWPLPMALGATGDPSLAERQGRIVAAEALAIGVNQILAPVADVNVDPENPVINVRSFGEDPEMVARFVVAFVRGVESGGVAATVKHFPGHGDTHTDSHRSLPVLEVSRERLEEVELVPFRAALSAGVSSVMVAHLSFPALDPSPAPVRSGGERQHSPYPGAEAEVAAGATTPASLSPRIVEELLRRELGFGGLVITDALDMGGITDHYDPGEAAVLAILAGADQILKSPDTDAAIAAVRRAALEGRIPDSRLDEAVARILAVKARFPVPRRPAPSKIFRVVDSPEHRRLAREIAARAITLVREEAGALPLAPELPLLHFGVSNSVETVNPALDFARQVEAKTGRPLEIVLFDPKSRPEEIETLLAAAGGTRAVLLTLHLRPRSEEGRIRVPEVAREAVRRLVESGVRVIAVSLGSPYAIRELPELRTYLAGYGGQQVIQEAAARALFGEAPITGRLPVTIPDIAPLGAGIQKPAVRPDEGGR